MLQREAPNRAGSLPQFGAPGRAHSLEGGSPLQVRQGELLTGWQMAGL